MGSLPGIENPIFTVQIKMKAKVKVLILQEVVVLMKSFQELPKVDNFSNELTIFISFKGNHSYEIDTSCETISLAYSISIMENIYILA